LGPQVYFTGRTTRLLQEIADEMTARGGEPHPVQVDHSSDDEVEKLFAKIGREQNGKLDVLVF
jgi:NADP-dependent 3-hydroxy acid dehydrogenase YdfG